jgi:hypothetical protein
LVWKRQNDINPIEQSSTVRIHNGILTILMATKQDEGNEKSSENISIEFLRQVSMNVLEVIQQAKISKSLNLFMLVYFP